MSEWRGKVNQMPDKLTGERPHGIWVQILRWIGDREFSVLVVLFLLFLALWGFVELAEEVMEGETGSFDRTLLLAMRDPADLNNPIGPGWLEEVGRDITALGGTAVLSMTTLVIIGYLLLDGKRRVALVLLIATLGALGISTILKQTFDRPRPDLVPHGVIVYTASFPSGHSMLAASTYLTLGVLLAMVQPRRTIRAYILACAVAVTLLVGISRVYLGVHWPTDVLAGWTAGAGWALICWLIARWLQIHGQIEREDEAKQEDLLNSKEKQRKRQQGTERNECCGRRWDDHDAGPENRQ